MKEPCFLIALGASALSLNEATTVEISSCISQNLCGNQFKVNVLLFDGKIFVGYKIFDNHVSSLGWLLVKSTTCRDNLIIAEYHLTTLIKQLK